MQSGSILVADDDAAIRTVLNQALSRAGYEVRSTGNATTLWRWVSQGEGDLVITDVVMPDENAFDMLPRIKKLRPDLPVVVMSAQNTLITAIRASERGAYDYLPKPFDLKELIAIVGRALTEPKTRQTARVAEDSEVTTGRRSEGVFFAAYAFVQKSVSGIGIFASSLLIGAIGFPRGAKPGQVDPTIVRNLGLAYAPTVVVLYLIALAFLAGYRIDRAAHEANLERLGRRPRRA